MIIHLVPQQDWDTGADPYAPTPLQAEGFVHCSDGEGTALAVAEAFLADAPRPVLALVLDERLLDGPVERVEGRVPGRGVTTRFPHVHGPIPRAAVTRVLEVRWDGGRPVALVPRRGNTAPADAGSHG